MKKTNIFILFAVLFFLPCSNTSAQSWLKKVSKALDNAGRQIDKQVQKLDEALTTEENKTEETSTTENTQSYGGIKIKSFNPQVDVTIESCIREGDITTINYSLKNNGPQLSIVSYATGKSIINPDDETNIFDNLGNSYKIHYQSLGKEYSQRSNKTIDFLLIQNVPMKGVIEIQSVDPRAKSFSLINIAGLTRVGQNFQPFSLTINDLPIYNIEDIINASTIKKVSEPYIERQTNADAKINSITITKEITRIEMAWANTKYTPYGTIWISNPEASYILLNGKKYRMLEFAGIGRKQGDVKVNYNHTQNFSVSFEKIPNDTEAFDLYFDTWHFFGVRMVPASSVVKSTPTPTPTATPTKPSTTSSTATSTSGLNIPKTKGLMSLDDAYFEYDNRKRITTTERTALKINQIKNKNFDIKWTNSKLAKGKLIYKGASGTLQTILHIEKENSVTEFLISYDANGYVADCISIGFIHAYGGDRGQTTIQGNEVLARFSAEGVDVYRKYTISPKLKFTLVKEWQVGEYEN